MQLPFPQFLPKSDWKAPKLSDLPDLSEAKEIAIDLETYDPELLTKGCGGVRGKGFVCGYAVACEGWSAYLPVRHSSGNLPFEPVQRWINHTLGNDTQPKITAYGSYDREWCLADGVEIKGTVYDIQIAECLLNEEKTSYKLEVLASEYLGQGKDEKLMDEAAWFYGENAKKIMHLLAASHVGIYAERDPVATLAVFQLQKVKLLEAGLWPIFQMESELSEVIHLMRQKGVRINEQGRDDLAKQYRVKENELYKSLQDKFFKGRSIDFNSGKDLANVCQSHSFTDYPRTLAGNPSFVGDWMDMQTDGALCELWNGISDFRTIQKIRRDYLEGHFTNTHKGRIHASIHQMNSDEGGTRSGRLAVSKPPLQGVPKRSSYAKDVRTLFLPEIGEEWIDEDYSQQEYRIFVHFGMLMNLEGAKEAGQGYIESPDADFHQRVAEMTGLSRSDAKNYSFAAIYGAGVAKTAKMTKKTLEEATKVSATYNEKVPFAKLLAKDVSNRATQRGWIKTLGGRVLHFETYEPAWSSDDEGFIRYKPLALPLALQKWPNKRLKRGQTHKALNRLVQGSAADMMKMAMLRLWKEFKVTPMLQVHDSLGASGDTKLALQMKTCMVESIKLLVPVQVDVAMGKTWGESKKIKL